MLLTARSAACRGGVAAGALGLHTALQRECCSNRLSALVSAHVLSEGAVL